MSFSILLVEDEAPKRAHIENFLKTLNLGLAVDCVSSVNSALDYLDDNLPDLMLLDMSLPTFSIGERESGGRPQGFGGIELLRHMSFSGYSCPTIVITGYEAFLRETGNAVNLSQIREELASEFPTTFRGVLHYNSTYDEWKLKLVAALAEFGVVDKTRGWF